MFDRLRVIDFGPVGALRSQTLWHAIAYGVAEGSPPTLSFAQPTEPYVSIGFHRSFDELDPAVCGPGGLPVFRRMVGGGPVYIDRGQLFFQVTVPVAHVSPRRGKAIRRLLEPAVAAFNDVGIAATLDGGNEVVLGDRKICGHAAGQIGDAVVVVGNVIDSFDHVSAASIVAVPIPEVREEFLRQMRAFVAATPTDFDAFVTAARRRYAEAFDCPAVDGELSSAERVHLERLDRLFVAPDWVEGGACSRGPWWRVKVKSGVWITHADRNGRSLTVTFHDGHVRTLRIRAGTAVTDLSGEAAIPVAEATRILEEWDAQLAELMHEMAAAPPV